MILVARHWRACLRCHEIKPWDDFHAKRKYEDGSTRTVQSLCKVCGTERNRELYGHKPRKPRRSKARALYVQRCRTQAKRRRMTEEEIVERQIAQRIQAKIRRMDRGGSVYSPSRNRTGKPLVDAYREEVGKDERFDPEPFLAWIDITFPGMSLPNVARWLGIPERELRWIRDGERKSVSILVVDRAFVSFGRPELLNAMYPLPTKGNADV